MYPFARSLALIRRAYDLAIELYMQALDLEPNHLEARRGLRTAELAKFDAYYPSRISRTTRDRLKAASGCISRELDKLQALATSSMLKRSAM